MSIAKKVLSKFFLIIPIILFSVFCFYMTLPSCKPPGEMSLHGKDYVFGIDVSKYQGKIDWSQVGTHHPIEFVFIRATMGKMLSLSVTGKGREKKDLFEGLITIIDPMKTQPNSSKIFPPR